MARTTPISEFGLVIKDETLHVNLNKKMSFQATVYKVLIASPSDVIEERIAIPEVINDWNFTHSKDNNVVLIPVKWENHSTPEMGGSPQSILNRQLVEDCDLLVGVFWTRIGTPTDEAESSTVEEIDKMRKDGKQVMLYFSSKKIVPDDINPDQLKLLTQFKEKCQREGISKNYNSIDNLREKLNHDLTSAIKGIHGELSFQSTNADKGIPTQPQSTQSDLEKEKVNILKLLADMVNKGCNQVGEDRIVSETGMSVINTQHHLSGLKTKRYIGIVQSVMAFTPPAPVQYRLLPKGREYLIKKGLV